MSPKAPDTAHYRLAAKVPLSNVNGAALHELRIHGR
jgi:hypothetical protein